MMTVFLCIVVILQLAIISSNSKRITQLEQENAFLRKKLHWKGVFNSDHEDV